MQELRILNLCKSYGDRAVLCDLSLTIPHGARVALMAPSGIGKTTLLQAMHNEVIEYKKTQEIIVHDDAIDTPGEYIDQSGLWRACIIAACDADIVVLVHDAGNIGKCIDECLHLALKMQREDENVFVPQQFENPANPEIQRKQTAKEILEQVGKPIDGFCAGIGTGGTLTGIGEVLKEANPDMEIWAVEPEDAAILSGGLIGTHIQMGIGDGLIPPILNTEIYNDICIVTDEEALNTAKELASKEGILCGISSGTNVAAAKKLAKKLGKGKTVIAVLPDTAERYFSTPLFDE